MVERGGIKYDGCWFQMTFRHRSPSCTLESGLQFVINGKRTDGVIVLYNLGSNKNVKPKTALTNSLE